MASTPPDCVIRTYPVVEKNDWLWVWMGDAESADPALIPDAWGVSDTARPMRWNSIEYDAHYQLVHDNLCDLSHVDFVHETTLKPATGADWSLTNPNIVSGERGLRFERWFEGAGLPRDPDTTVDTWSVYEFCVPGIFILYSARFPAGTAAACQYGNPEGFEPIVENVEQQAVTPIDDKRTAYHYATGLVLKEKITPAEVDRRMEVVMRAFEEDRQMIEAQQRIWDRTSPSVPKAFITQDQGPSMMRRLMRRLMSAEQAEV